MAEYSFSVVVRYDGEYATYAWSPGRVDWWIDGVRRGSFIWLSSIVVPVGSRLKLEAVASAGWYFAFFDINGQKIYDNPYEFTPTGNGYIHAYFSNFPQSQVPGPTQPSEPTQPGGFDLWAWLRDWWWVLLLIILVVLLVLGIER